MRTTSVKALLVFTLITVFGAVVVLAPPNSKKVKGTINGTIVFTPPDVTAGIYAIRVECEGTLPHLGRCRAVWEGNASLDAGLVATPLTGTGWSIESADGSTMHGAVQWHPQNGSVPGVYTVTGPFQLVAGTGRFEDATGRGTISGTVNVLTRKASIQLDAELQ
jgi:hypothetical protein